MLSAQCRVADLSRRSASAKSSCETLGRLQAIGIQHSSMTWQKKARLAIAAVRDRLRGDRDRRAASAEDARRPPPPIPAQGQGLHSREHHRRARSNRSRTARVVFGSSSARSAPIRMAGRSLANGVEITSNRNGKPFTVTSREADIVQNGDELKTAHFMTAVKLTSEGTEVTADEANYDQSGGHPDGAGRRRVHARTDAGHRRRRDLRLQS